jgi:hypothetical protein
MIVYKMRLLIKKADLRIYYGDRLFSSVIPSRFSRKTLRTFHGLQLWFT